MNKLTILFLTIFLTTINVGCQDSKKTKETEKTIDMINTDLIKNVLLKQLKQGANQYFDEAGVEISKKEFDISEFDACVERVDDILQSNGFKKLTIDEFNSKIKKIFNRIIDTNSINKYLYVDYLHKCDISLNRNPNNFLDHYGTYVVKQQRFITDFYYLPQILDYQKEYPELAKIETNLVLKYKDNEGDYYTIETWDMLSKNNDKEFNLAQQRNTNIQTLVHRNKYLFNDNKGSLAWLKSNDEYFLESLVTTFGYTEDKDLLDWVMLKNRSKAKEFIKNNVFVRKCKGELEIREDILKYIEQTTNEKEHLYFEELPPLYYDTTNNDFWNQFNEKESYKILAYLANTYDYLFMKYQNVRKNKCWNILGSIFYYSAEGEGEKWKKIDENFKANNYYNLPHLKEVLSYAHEFESVGAPD